MFTCASCKNHACLTYDKANPPKNCPMHEEALMKKCVDSYFEEDDGKFYKTTMEVADEAKNKRYTRVLQAIAFAKKMGWHKIGLAHCIGFCKEAEAAARLIRAAGLEAESIVCTTGATNLCEFMTVSDASMDDKAHNFSVGCNPIAQARFLEEAGTEYNLVFGLCVGHDSLFMQHSHCPASVMMVKDYSKFRDSRMGLFEAVYDVEHNALPLP